MTARDDLARIVQDAYDSTPVEYDPCDEITDAILAAGWIYQPDGRITEEQARNIIAAGWLPPLEER